MVFAGAWCRGCRREHWIIEVTLGHAFLAVGYYALVVKRGRLLGLAQRVSIKLRLSAGVGECAKGQAHESSEKALFRGRQVDLEKSKE